MNLRARLVVAFFLLAVVPISLLTYFGFQSSKRALRSAVEKESAEAAEELGRQMELVMSSLDESLDQLGDLPWPLIGEHPDRSETDWRRLYEDIRQRVGDAVPLLESLEFSPFAESGRRGPPGQPAPPAPPVPDSSALGGGPLRFYFSSSPTGEPFDFKVEHGDASERTFVFSADSPPPPPPAPPPADRVAQKQAAEALKNLEKSLADQAAAAGHPISSGEQQARAAVDKAAAELAGMQKRARLQFLIQHKFDSVLQQAGKPWARVHARVNPSRVLRRVFERGPSRAGEILFAVDAEGRLYAPQAEGQQTLASLGLPQALERQDRAEVLRDWVVVTRHEPRSGTTLGIARPIAAPLREMRQAAFVNLGLGLFLLTLAVFGILPLSNRITKNLRGLTQGAERLAKGDLDARVPVRSKDEFGRLADAFNRMAVELKAHQRRLVEQERLQKELEMGRRIQEEMLPRGTLRLPFAEAKGVSIPAREVGGDFFNYFALPDGKIGILVGDVSGKGVAAALLMANIQATLRARMTSPDELQELTRLLDEEIAEQTPEETYLTLFLGVYDPSSGTLRWVNAGHNAQYALRSEGRLEALASTGRPLGLLPGGGYTQKEISLRPGDALFLYTDGLVEAESPAGDPFGNETLESILRKSAQTDIDELLKCVEEAVRRHRDGAEAGDDATLVALKIGSRAQVAAM